jgi:hypothetical protein
VVSGVGEEAVSVVEGVAGEGVAQVVPGGEEDAVVLRMATPSALRLVLSPRAILGRISPVRLLPR